MQAQHNQSETGVIAENLLDGRYIIKSDIGLITATNQTGKALQTGMAVTVTTTKWGKYIVSTGNIVNTLNQTKVTIKG